VILPSPLSIPWFLAYLPYGISCSVILGAQIKTFREIR
jgi:hypothetical protein